MKRSGVMGRGLLLLVLLLSGCITLPSIGKTPAADQGDLYTKVPAAMRAPVNEAEYDLKQARTSIDFAKEKVKLAEMQKQRSHLENDYANCALKLAEIVEKKATVSVDLKKIEAIENSGLGDKESNIKQIADLRTRELGIESDRVRAKAEVDTLDVKIKKLAKEIEAQEKKVKK
jgi:predicted  nucleic acid-binding Zn-ribbon protein